MSRSFVVALVLACLTSTGCQTSHREPWSAERVPVAREGYIPVEGGRVWYTVAGDGPGTPLIVLHGGPGAPHDYLSNLSALGADRPVVFYDQLGCRKSDRPDDTRLWTRERFVRELAIVLDHLHIHGCFILGQSWGTVLAADYLLTHPRGVRGVVFSSEALSIPRTVAHMQVLIEGLPPEVRDVIRRAERDGTTQSPEYQRAVDVFYHRHLCRLDPWPQDLTRTFEGLGRGVYGYMNGPSEFTITGTIKDVDVTPRLGEIRVPALFLTGQYDEVPPAGAADDAARISGATAVVIPGASHLCNLEQPSEYLRIVGSWLREHDSGR